jgi:hypothetical protein
VPFLTLRFLYQGQNVAAVSAAQLAHVTEVKSLTVLVVTAAGALLVVLLMKSLTSANALKMLVTVAVNGVLIGAMSAWLVVLLEAEQLSVERVPSVMLLTSLGWVDANEVDANVLVKQTQ